jgi:hypothetical protein
MTESPPVVRSSVSVLTSAVAVAYHEPADVPMYTWEMCSLSALDGEMWCRMVIPAARSVSAMTFY